MFYKSRTWEADESGKKAKVAIKEQLLFDDLGPQLPRLLMNETGI